MSNTSPEQDKEIAERIIRIEQALQEMNKDIKQIKAIHNNELTESIMQIQSQITNLQTDLEKTDKTINESLANIENIKKKKGKKRGKKDKTKGKKK